MCSASNRPAEADTASRLEIQPVTPSAPQPVPRVAMPQTWRRLTFLHWHYAPDRIRRFIPPGLELDTFDGKAWVGLIPFEIYNIPGVPHFPETNVRTYVVGPDGSRAVWFFSLDAGRLAAVVGARIGYHLPYFWAKMRVASDSSAAVYYKSRRRWPHDSRAMTNIAIQPGAPYKANELTELDHSLTARFRLYTASRQSLRYAQIDHPPWPLTRASIINLQQSLVESAGLPSASGVPLVHYAAELAVNIGRLI